VKAIIDAIHVDESGPFNLGTGQETSVKELVETISNLVGFKGDIVWDASKPNGQPRRFYDMNKFKEAFGYVPNTSLIEGLKKTIEWYESNK
jgi:GDP-L-fucose synthase